MKKQAYIHMAFNNKTKIIGFVKATRYTEKAHQTQCNNALIVLGHNDFVFISYPMELNSICTKNFKGFLGDSFTDERDMQERLKSYITFNDL